MNKMLTGLSMGAIAVGAFVALAQRSGNVQAQTRAAAAPAPAAPSSTAPPPNLDDMLLRWPVLPGNEKYSAIDGRHLHGYVDEQVAISRRYRDQGHPKFWGRIIGTSSDVESADWLAAKFKALGLSDVHIQPVDLGPTWMPQTWDVVVTGGGKTVRLETAQPDYGSTGTPRGRPGSRGGVCRVRQRGRFRRQECRRQGRLLVRHHGHEVRRRPQARRREGRGRDLRSQHVAGQSALRSVPVRHEGAGLRRGRRRWLRGTRSDRVVARRGSLRASRCRST